MGVDARAGARVPVALAALTLARLVERGIPDVTVAAAADGYRVKMLLPESGDAVPAVRALREALTEKATAAESLAAASKVASLGHHALRDAAAVESARCRDEAFVPPEPETILTVDTLDGWRAASHALGRVVFGVTGPAGEVEAVAHAIQGLPPWPVSAVPLPAVSPAAPVPPELFESRAPRGVVLLHTATAASAALVARDLGDPNGALSVRLRALDAPAVLRSVEASASLGAGCVEVVADLPPRMADALSVMREEAVIAAMRAMRESDAEEAPSPVADPRDAAELAAWWALGREREASASPPVAHLLVGLPPSTDPAEEGTRGRALLAELAREAPERALEVRLAEEPGQGTLEMLLASPCGTTTEGEGDAGLTALAVASVVEQSRRDAEADGVELSEWITSDGVGVRLHAVRRPLESDVALARRAADRLGAAFLALPPDAGAVDRARASLLSAGAAMPEEAAFGVLSEALVPGHPSWTFPLSEGRGLDAPSGAALSRLSALRHGPLRLAVLAGDPALLQEVVAGVDRWAPRAPGARVCPAMPAAPPPRPGTYASPSDSSSVWLALPLARGHGGALHDAAVATAAALDGPSGLLSRALSSGLASSWAAKVVGAREAPALVVHVTSTGQALDAAVAQLRALFDRLRQGALSEADRTYAASRLAEQDLRSELTREGRLQRLWRGDPRSETVPSLESLRAFLADSIKDDAWIIVASRPPLAEALKPTP